MFGYYTIFIRKLLASQVPPQFGLQPGSTLEEGVKVFHIFWIPISPFGKDWVLKKDGDSYKVPYDVSTALTKIYGKSKTPWYSFIGIILAIVGGIGFKINEGMESSRRQAAFAEQKEKQESEFLNKLAAPNTDDYYALKAGESKYAAGHVTAVRGDSVELATIADGTTFSRVNKNSVLEEFILDRKDIQKDMVAISDLKKATIAKDSKVSTAPLVLGAIDEGRIFSVEQVFRVAASEMPKLSVRDEAVSLAVEKTFNTFINDPSVDTSVSVLDSASITYLREIYDLGESDNYKKMKKFIDESKYSSVDYGMVLHAHYTYFGGEKEKREKTGNLDFNTFIFFSKLINSGLWSIDDHVKKARISNIRLVGNNQASGTVSLNSNILDSQKNMRFDVDFNFENDNWKINLPTTFKYTENQIMNVGRNFQEGRKQYRQMIRTGLNDLDKQRDVNKLFFY